MSNLPIDGAPPLEFGELTHDLAHGWVRIRGRGDVWDPRLAYLVTKLLLADIAVIRDITEGNI